MAKSAQTQQLTITFASAATPGNREKDEQHGFNEIIVTREGDHSLLRIQRFARKESSRNGIPICDVSKQETATSAV